MGGKGSPQGNVDPALVASTVRTQTALTDIATQQAANAQQLYGLTEPGLQTAEEYFQTLSAGEPSAIMRAVAPQLSGANEAATGAKANILANAPAGGEKNLALEAVDVARGSNQARTVSGAVSSGPVALAALAGQGIGESISAAGTGISGLSQSGQLGIGLGGLEMQGQQIQAEQKGNMLGSIASGAGTAAELAIAFI